ncbi:hypothetical protein [Companilactobacillus sp. HBUAS59699]|uniref:hypothetical protein n=1 Tax=Companilactobacillus sp. HBUAS59699 TaxID=3109358 RepID=UPI002FF3EB12
MEFGGECLSWVSSPGKSEKSPAVRPLGALVSKLDFGLRKVREFQNTSVLYERVTRSFYTTGTAGVFHFFPPTCLDVLQSDRYIDTKMPAGNFMLKLLAGIFFGFFLIFVDIINNLFLFKKYIINWAI